MPVITPLLQGIASVVDAVYKFFGWNPLIF